MSNSLTPLVPEKTYAVCTNGTKRGEMVVGHHDNVMKKNTCLFATIQDKPTNFACVYIGILIAIIGALLTALFVSGVGATIGCLLLAVLAGILAAYGLQGVVCNFCLRPSSWDSFHPKVIINGEPAILGTSTIICQPPLPFFTAPGNITLFYSKEVAGRVANIYRWNNWQRIFNAATSAYAIPSFIYNAASGFVTGGILRGIIGLFTSSARAMVGGTCYDYAKNGIASNGADGFNPRNPNISTDDTKFSSVYKEEEWSPDWDNLYKGEDIFNWPKVFNATQYFKYSNSDRSRIMLWRHRVWGRFQSGNSAPLKTAWRWDKQLGFNKQSANRAVGVLLFDIIGDISLGMVVNSLKNSFINDLPELENTEDGAKAKVGVFEKII